MYQLYNRWITRFIIPVIALVFIMVGRPVPIWSDLTNRDLYFDLLFAVLIALITWHLVLFSHEKLDNTHSWYTNFYKRAFYQALFGIALPAVIMMGLYYGYMKLYYHKYFSIEQSSFFDVDLPVGILLILLMNLGLVLIFLIHHNKAKIQPSDTSAHFLPQPDHADGTTAVKTKQHMLSVKGSKNMLLAINDIAYILLEKDVSKAYTFAETSTVIGDPLDALMSQLPSTFYRANRQCIINLQAIKGFKAERSGKLILQIHPEPHIPITVSQKQSVAFKKWLLQTH